MRNITLRGLVAVAIVLAGIGMAGAQESTNVIGTDGDWTAFAGQSPKECWAVSPPKSTVNTKDGKEVEVTRGDIRLYVAYRSGSAGQISFTGGYPFAADSPVELNVDGQKFTLFTEGENAWTGSPSEDAKVIAALRAGTSAVATGRSSRGTTTRDTFSLSGVTAMTNLAQSTCK